MHSSKKLFNYEFEKSYLNREHYEVVKDGVRV